MLHVDKQITSSFRDGREKLRSLWLVTLFVFEFVTSNVVCVPSFIPTI
jgi:hypothetical protein